jgi:hypothetical protein
MGKANKLFAGLILSAGILYAADGTAVVSSGSSTVDNQASITTQPTVKNSTAKARSNTPVPKTNWSKIKDLFM